MRIAYIVLSVLLLLCLLPVLSTLAAGLIAAAAGCPLDEGSVHGCIILGADWGGTLYTAAMMGWFGLITLPFAAAFALALVLLAFVHLIRYLRR